MIYRQSGGMKRHTHCPIRVSFPLAMLDTIFQDVTMKGLRCAIHACISCHFGLESRELDDNTPPDEEKGKQKTTRPTQNGIVIWTKRWSAARMHVLA